MRPYVCIEQFLTAGLILFGLMQMAWATPVCSVHDGDTIRLCSGERIRLWGIDAPELKQPLGMQARDYASALLLNQDVSVSCNGKSYQRLVCVVTLQGLDMNALMVAHGFAFDSPRYSKGYYQNAQAYAQEYRLGVWQLPDGGQRPWVFRHATKSVHAG